MAQPPEKGNSIVTANNPIAELLAAPLDPDWTVDALAEKILSAIVEFKTGIENVPAVLRRVDEVSKTLETVVAVGVATRCDQTGGSALDAILNEEGFSFVRGKTNLGLGHASL